LNRKRSSVFLFISGFRTNLENLEKELIFKKIGENLENSKVFLKIYTGQGKVMEKYFYGYKKMSCFNYFTQ